MSAGHNRQLSFEDRIRQLEKEAEEVRQNIKRISKRKKVQPPGMLKRTVEQPVEEEVAQEPDGPSAVPVLQEVNHPDDLFSLSTGHRTTEKRWGYDQPEDESDDLQEEAEELDLEDADSEKEPGLLSGNQGRHVGGGYRASGFKMDEKFAGYLASGSFMPMGRREPDPKVMRNKAIFLLIVLGVVAYSVYWLIKVL